MTAPRAEAEAEAEDRAEAHRRDAASQLSQAKAISAGHPELERLLRLANGTALLGILEVLQRMETRSSSALEEMERLRADNVALRVEVEELRRQLETQRGYAERLRARIASLNAGKPWP